MLNISVNSYGHVETVSSPNHTPNQPLFSIANEVLVRNQVLVENRLL